MDTLMKELGSASDLLEHAINRYIDACAAILGHFEPSGHTAQGLLGSVVAELPRASVYKGKLQKAMALMWRVRNQSPSFVLINVLPPEVMSRIFWFSEPCCLPKSRFTRRNAQTDDQLIYPEVALDVCYRWRQVSLASNDLWSHIDIDLTSGSEGSLFTRALGFAARSSQAPIDLHIRIDFFWRDDQRLTEFCRSIAPRTRSLDLQCDGRSSLSQGALSLLASLFLWATPGTLRRLCIDAQPMRKPGFLVTNDSIPLDHNSCLLQNIPLSKPLFEDILSPITNLQLDGMYPYWTSRAYTGLIELHLEISKNCEISISESDLVNVLRASPGLRFFRFGLKLTFDLGVGSFTSESIYLSHLETIQLGGRYLVAQEAVLRMVYPGQLPLQMTTEVTEHFSSLSPYWVQFINFISRSKVTQLQIQGAAPFKVYIGASEVFPLLPQLQVLKLCGVILGQACEEVLGDYDATSFLSLLHDDNNVTPRQNLWFARLVNCRVYWNDFRHISEIHPTQILKLDECELITTPLKRPHDLYSSGWDATRLLRDAARRVCPVVELTGTRGKFEEQSKFKLGSFGPGDETYDTSGFAF